MPSRDCGEFSRNAIRVNIFRNQISELVQIKNLKWFVKNVPTRVQINYIFDFELEQSFGLK